MANASRPCADALKSKLRARTRAPSRASITSTSSALTFTSAALTNEPAQSASAIGNEPARMRIETTALGLRAGVSIASDDLPAFAGFFALNIARVFLSAPSLTNINTSSTSPRRRSDASTLASASLTLRSLACAVVRNGFALPSNQA